MSKLDVALWGLPDNYHVKDPADDGINTWYSTVEAVGEDNNGTEWQIWQRAKVLNTEPEEYIEQQFALFNCDTNNFVAEGLEETEAIEEGFKYGVKWMCWTAAIDQFMNKLNVVKIKRTEYENEIASRIKDGDDVTEILAAYKEVFSEDYKQ